MLSLKIFKRYKLRGLCPLFLCLITTPKLLTNFNIKFLESREKAYTFAPKSKITNYFAKIYEFKSNYSST